MTQICLRLRLKFVSNPSQIRLLYVPLEKAASKKCYALFKTKPKPEDIKTKDIKSKNNKSKDNKSKDNKSKDNKSKDNKSKDNKPHETIDLRDDNDESCVLGFLFCVFLVSLGMVYNKLTYETFQSLLL